MKNKIQKNTLIAIGKQIKVERAKKGLTQKDLADDVGISTDTLSRIEKGKANQLLTITIHIYFKLGLNFPNDYVAEYQTTIS